MLSVFKNKPQIVKEAQKAKFMPKAIPQFFLFIAVVFISQIITAIPLTIYMFVDMFKNFSLEQEVEISSESIQVMTQQASDSMVLPMLFLTIIVTIITIIFCKFIEKRSLYSMGFVKKHAIRDYFFGLIIGLVMFSVGVLIAYLTGSLVYNGYILGGGIGLLLLFFVGFLIQGMSEEVLVRGYFMVSLATKKSLFFAVMANSLVFAGLHLLNPGITILSIVNLTLFGVFASVFVLKTNSLWGICAIHSIWNFAQGNVFGIKVSGMDTQASLFSFSSVESKALINGGNFGLEGGLAVTIVLVVATLIVMVVGKKKASDQAVETVETTISAQTN